MSGPTLDDSRFDAVFDVKLPSRPYPGLRPFEKDEWPVFFGREAMADAVVGRLVAQRVLVVHGDSGCGKSSLVRAAVLPRLEQDNARGGILWRTCTMTPGQSPLLNLAEALAGLAGGPVDPARVLAIRRILNLGATAPEALAEHLLGDSDCVCIVFDQFEELFAHARLYGNFEAQLLVDFLVSLFKAPPKGLYAALTMRSEFIGACARFSGFAEVVNATQYLLPRMEHCDLVRAIREPATLYGGQISWQLAERLIADARGGQDQLPLIQHGLMLLYREHVAGNPSDGWNLGLEHYRNPRGLAGQLSDHADAVMAEAQAACLSTGGARVVERMFRALSEINSEGLAIRRPQTLAQLLQVTGADRNALVGVIDRFRADGNSLLRPHGDEPLADDDLIDISHEALIRSWEKLADPGSGWLFCEFRDGLVWRALLVHAEGFERDPSNTLGTSTTDERERWMQSRNETWAERYGGGWQRVQSLLAASARERDRERSRVRRMRTLRQVGLFLAMGLALMALYWSYQEAVVVARKDAQNEVKSIVASAAATKEKLAVAQSKNAELIQVVETNTAIVEKLASSNSASAVELRQVGDALAAAAQSNTGYMWLGNAGARNLRDDSGSVDVAKLRPGITYRSSFDSKLRASLPTPGNKSGEMIGLIRRGSSVELLAEPRLVETAGGPQSWAQVRVAPPRDERPLVYLQFAEGSDTARNVLVRQLSADFVMAPSERLDRAAGVNAVRYCHQGDYGNAAGLVEAIEKLRPGLRLSMDRLPDRNCAKVTNPGTLELWLDRVDGDSAVGTVGTPGGDGADGAGREAGADGARPAVTPVRPEVRAAGVRADPADRVRTREVIRRSP